MVLGRDITTQNNFLTLCCFKIYFLSNNWKCVLYNYIALNFVGYLTIFIVLCVTTHGVTDHCELFNFTADFAGSDLQAQTSSIDGDVSAKPLSPRLCKMALSPRLCKMTMRGIYIKRLFPPRLELRTFRVLGERDNHYTTETAPIRRMDHCFHHTMWSKGVESVRLCQVNCN